MTTSPNDVAGETPGEPVVAMRAELQRVSDELFELLYTGGYYFKEGSDNAGYYYYCDGIDVIRRELVEGRVCAPQRFESETAAIDHMLWTMSDPWTRGITTKPYSTCGDEDIHRTLANLRHVRRQLLRWTIWKYLDGLHFHHVWPRRLRRNNV